MSYDIECYSSDGIKFPQASVPEDQIIQIGLTLTTLGNEQDYKQIILTLKECLPIEGVEIYSFNNEQELLVKFSEIIMQYDPDIILSYNGYRFDDHYIHQRLVLSRCADTFL